MNEKVPEVAQAATLLGIASQLYTTRVNALLNPHGLSLSQFALLNHLARSSRESHSVSELTAALEMNQPGITKIVHKLSREKLMSVEVDKADSRRRQVAITTEGRQKLSVVSAAVYPDVHSWFESWNTEELDQFVQHLTKLVRWLDANRIKS